MKIQKNKEKKKGGEKKRKGHSFPHESCSGLVHGEITHVNQPHQLSADGELIQQLLQPQLCPSLLSSNSQVDKSTSQVFQK